MRREGIAAQHFARTDKKDLLIPPFALFYFYLVLASAFGLPTVSRQAFVQSDTLSWIGVARQVLREEAYLREHYGQEYLDYCRRVRRYV